MGIRKAALIACVAAVAGNIAPVWNALSRTLALAAGNRQWWILPLVPLEICFMALMPAFYFALFRDPGPLRFPHYLRRMALVAAIALVAVAMVRIGQGGSITWFTVIGLVSTASYILLLLTMSRDAPDEPAEETSPSELLVSLTKMTVLLWGLWVAFQFVRIAIIFSTYSQLKQVAFQWRRAAPPESEMAIDVVLTFFSQAGLLAAPFIVWRSGFGRTGVN